MSHFRGWQAVAHGLTLFRVPAPFVILWLIDVHMRGMATAAFVVFLVAAFSDWLDGHLARRFCVTSNIGKFMDALTDKVFVICLLVIALNRALLPAGALVGLLLVITREFLVTGLRLVAAGQGQVIGAEAMGKQKTVFQMFTLGLIFFNHMLAVDWFVQPFTLQAIMQKLALVCFALAVCWTVLSGLAYLRKYWFVFEKEQHFCYDRSGS